MDIQSFLEIDRQLLNFFNGSSSLFLDGMITTLTSGITWIPLYISLIYLIIRNNDTMPQIMLIIGCSLLCVILSDGISDGLVKPLVARPRPSNDLIIKYSIDIVNDMRGSGYSFFSAHAANTSSIALFFCLLVRKRILTITLILWSLLNCYTRLYLGLHYPSDIVIGLIWGCISGTIAYLLYRSMYKRLSSTNEDYSSQQPFPVYRSSDVDIVVTIVVFTILYSIFHSVIYWIQ